MKKYGRKSHIDSAKYEAVKLIQSLEECFYTNRQIAINEKEQTRDRMEASPNVRSSSQYIQDSK